MKSQIPNPNSMINAKAQMPNVLSFGFGILFVIWILTFDIAAFAAFSEPTCDPNVDPGACNTPPPVWNQTSTTQSGGFRLNGDATAGRLCLDRCIAGWNEISGLRLPLDPIYFTDTTGDKIGLRGPLKNPDGTSVANVNAIGIENDSTDAPTIVTYRSGGGHRFFGADRTQANLRITPEGNLIGRGTFTSLGRAQIGLFVTSLSGSESLIGGAMNYNAAEANTKLLDLGAYSGFNSLVSRLQIGQGGDLTLRGSASKIDVKSPAQLISGTTGEDWSSQGELALVLQQTDPLTGTVYKLPNAGRFILRNETTSVDNQEVKLAWISRSALGTISRIGGYFLDRQYNTSVTLNTSGTAARFTGPVSVNGNTSITGNLSATGQLTLGASTNLNPQVRTLENLEVKLDTDNTNPKAELRVKNSADTQVLILDEDGNLTIRGTFSQGGSSVGQFNDLHLTAANPHLWLGIGPSDTLDRTLLFEHKDPLRRAHLSLQGNFLMPNVTPTILLGASTTDTADRTITIRHQNASQRAHLSLSGNLSAQNISGASILASFYKGTAGGITIGDDASFMSIDTGISAAIVDGDFKLPNGYICLDNGGGACDTWTPVTGRIRMDTWTSATSDIAEPFSSESSLAAGTLVRSIGQTRVAKTRGAYDRQVIGVVSVKPGGILGDVGEGDILVAIVGRVLVNVVSENGSIAVGDLLTSSSTPGYAMRCSDPIKCFGAVIGKALEPFNRQQGTILILLGLQ